MSGSLPPDVVLRARIGSRPTERLLRFAAGSTVRIYVDVLLRLTGQLYPDSAGWAAAYLAPDVAAEEGPAQPLEVFQPLPGVVAMDVPALVPGYYTVWFSIQEPSRQAGAIHFLVPADGGAPSLTSQEWSDLQAVAAAVAASAADGVARARVPEIARPVAEDAALSVTQPLVADAKTARDRAVEAEGAALASAGSAEADRQAAQQAQAVAVEAAQALASSVAAAALPVTTLAVLQTIVGTFEGQLAEVYADPPAPVLANPDGSCRNGYYRWSGTAWAYNGPSPTILGRMLERGAGTVAHRFLSRYDELLGWITHEGRLVAWDVDAATTLAAGGREVARSVDDALRLGGSLMIDPSRSAGYLLGLRGIYDDLRWVLLDDGTTSEGRSLSLRADAVDMMLRGGASSRPVRVLDAYDAELVTVTGAGVMEVMGVRVDGGSEIRGSARDDYSVAIKGRYDEIIRAWLPDGADWQTPTETPTTSFSEDFIASQAARAMGIRAARIDRVVLETQPPTADINIALVVGQSLLKAHEAWGGLLLTAAEIAAIAPGLRMFGNSEHPQTSLSLFQPFGAAALNPLAGTVISNDLTTLLDPAAVAALPPGDGARGESPGIAASVIARRMWLDSLGVEDDGREWVVLNCAVSGRTIEELVYGSGGANHFRIVTDAVSKIKAIADAAGKTCRVHLVLFGQGEYNYASTWGGTTDQAAYLALLEQYRVDIFERACAAILGQTRHPLWVTYQTGAGYTRDAALMSVGNAQRQFAANHPGQVVMASPHYPVTDKGNHLDLMGSRWLGCLYGRAAGSALTRRQGWLPVEPSDVALRRGRQVLVPMVSPWANLQWRQPYRASVATSVDQRGFELVDDLGQVPLTAEIKAGVCLLLTAVRDFVGPVWVQAAPESKFGLTELMDTDPSVCPLSYTYTPGTGQYAAADIPALVGQPFPLVSPCAAFRILTTAI